MICLLHNYCLIVLSPAITSLARSLNASGEKVSKNSWYLALSQISILSIAETKTISFSRPAYSIRFLGSKSLPAPSGLTCVAPFKKYRLNCLTFGSKSFNLPSSEKIGSQLAEVYKLRHFSNPRFTTKTSVPLSGNCFLKPTGSRKRPFASRVASYSPMKPVMLYLFVEKNQYPPQNNTFSHFCNIFSKNFFIHKFRKQTDKRFEHKMAPFSECKL